MGQTLPWLLETWLNFTFDQQMYKKMTVTTDKIVSRGENPNRITVMWVYPEMKMMMVVKMTDLYLLIITRGYLS